jgi:hypothetical protein
VASSAYLNALAYAKERKQGANFRAWKDPAAPRVPIFEHPDIRRSLMDMKSHVEGIRALAAKLAYHGDSARLLSGKDDEKAAYHRGQVELLTPLVKAFGSDEGVRLCSEAIQVYGGAGFLKDHPVEQYLRDSKIFCIYEGTNHIQAMDLVGRKLGQAGGQHFQQFLGDITQFIEANRSHPRLGAEVEALGLAQESVMSGAMALLGWSQDKAKFHLIPLNANRFLKMMSQLAVGWLLLESAVIAEKALLAVPAGSPERAFYEGKRFSAQWFARNILANVKGQGERMGAEDSSPMEMPDAAFAAQDA